MNVHCILCKMCLENEITPSWWSAIKIGTKHDYNKCFDGAKYFPQPHRKIGISENCCQKSWRVKKLPEKLVGPALVGAPRLLSSQVPPLPCLLVDKRMLRE